jgi:MarR family transcriptional regulator, negative regulator of the multidrug operon emrRAB
MSPRWLREDERDSIPWERRQDHRLENLFGALVVTLGERVQERMGAAAGCPPTAVAALQWIGRWRRIRSSDLAQVLELTPPGASHLVGALIAAGLIERTRYPHDGRQWALDLTQQGARRTLQAMKARAEVIRESLQVLPFPWRLRLVRITERLLSRRVDSRQAVLRVCRHCDWELCRRGVIEPCPVAVAWAGRTTSSRRD